MARLDGDFAEPSIEVVDGPTDLLFRGITPFEGVKLGGPFGTGSGAVTFSIAGAGIRITEFANNTFSRDFAETYPYDVEPVIRQAFTDWSDAGDVDFVQVVDDGVDGAETSVAYARYFHGVPQRSGNYGGVYFPSERPTGGNAMIADAPITRPETAFLDTILHQIGHIIGLGQTQNQDSVMLPSVFFGLPGLGVGDIAAAEVIYGPQDSAPITYRLSALQDDVDAVFATDLLVIEGNARANSLYATDAADTLNGHDGDDRLMGRQGDDVIDGGLGSDTAVFRGAMSAYGIEGNADAAVVSGPDGVDTLRHVEQLLFDDGSVSLVAQGLTSDEAQVVALLYEAALDRNGNIDLPGLNFWIDQREAGLSDAETAQFFLDGPEFEAAFGDPGLLSDEQLVEVLYENILDRPGEPDGVAFWTGVVADPGVSRAELLLAFANSPENRAGSSFVTTLTEVAEGEWAFLA